MWTAVAHIITGVIGSGVLSLAWSMAQLGWIAGPLSILCFAIITVYSNSLLAYSYRYPDPVHGPSRNHSYLQAVQLYLGTYVMTTTTYVVVMTLFMTYYLQPSII